MIDYSKIYDHNLQLQIKASLQFNSLPEEKKLQFFNRIVLLPPSKQKGLADFLMNKNSEYQKQIAEKDGEKLPLIQKFTTEIIEMHEKFKKKLKKDPEKKAHIQDQEELETLLNQLENC